MPLKDSELINPRSALGFVIDSLFLFIHMGFTAPCGPAFLFYS